MRRSYMIWIFDVCTRRSCSKALWVSFSVCPEQNMKRTEQFGVVSNLMKSDCAHSLRRYKYVKGNLISLNGFPLVQLSLFHLHFVQLCFPEFVKALAELELACWYTIRTANYFGKSLSNMYALQLILFFLMVEGIEANVLENRIKLAPESLDRKVKNNLLPY